MSFFFSALEIRLGELGFKPYIELQLALGTCTCLELDLDLGTHIIDGLAIGRGEFALIQRGFALICSLFDNPFRSIVIS